MPIPVAETRETSSLLSRGLRRVFSFPAAIAGVLCALAVLTARDRFNDPDMWWHLKTGQFIWTTGSLPTVDPYSFTALGQRWIPHEWFSQLALYGTYRLGGYSGMMAAFCCLSAALLVAGYALCAMYSRNVKVAFIGAFVLFLFATSGFSIRPQLLGYLLLIVEMIVLHLGRCRNPRWFLALPPLFALWVNCHGSFFLGLIVAGTLLLSSFFHFETGSLIAEPWTARRRQLLTLALTLSAAATLVNPIGIKLVLFPLDTILHQPIGLALVQEWQPLQLSSQRGICLLAVLAIIFLWIVLSKAVLYLDELLLLALGVWLAGSHVRMLFVFGILAAPILARMLAGSWGNYRVESDRPVANAILLALSAVAIYFAFPRTHNIDHQIEAQNPVKAVEFIRSHHLTGPMLNEYGYGGYLIWAAPERPVFIDGRSEVYEWSGLLTQFAQWISLQANPNTLLDRYQVQICLISAQSPMAHVLSLLHGWQSVYNDGNSIVFERTQN
jgi:hypothetical protein